MKNYNLHQKKKIYNFRRAKFKEKIEPKKIKRRSEEQYDLPDLPPSKLESGMYGDLHYDRDAVGEVCGINEW